ncbi:MAG: anti-sigma factor [Acidobacteriota bacterium]|jgi:anti-sigma factor RsiW
MNGEHPLEALSAYLDGELDAAARRALERHLEACAACAGVLVDLRRMAEVSRDETIPPVPADLGDRILDRLPERRRGGLPFRVPMAAAATLAAMGVLCIVWLRDPGLQPDPMRSTPEHPLDVQEPPVARRPIRSMADSRTLDEVTGDVAAPSPPPSAMPETEDEGLPANLAPATAAPRAPEPATTFSQEAAPKPQSPAREADARRQDGGVPPAKHEPGAGEGAAAGAPSEEAPRREAATAGRVEAKSAMEDAMTEDRDDALRRQASARVAQRSVGLLGRADVAPELQSAAQTVAGQDDVLPAGAWLLVDPDYSVRLDPDGSLRLRSGTFSCSLPPAPGEEDAALLAGLNDEAIAAEPPPAASRKREEGVSAPAATAEGSLPETMVLRVGADGGAVAVAPDVAPEVAARLLALAGRRYTPEVKATCGELPAALLEVMPD